MLQQIAAWNTWINGYVWGWPTIVLLLGTGVLLTVVTGAVQFRYLGRSLREVLGKITQKRVGAAASRRSRRWRPRCLDGRRRQHRRRGDGDFHRRPWASSVVVSGLLGMCTKYAEIVIAMQYREPDATGTMRGGAMYTLKALGMPWLGTIFAALVSLAAFGIGNMVQANSVADSLRSSFGIAPSLTGIVLAAITAVVILGGIKRIGEVTEILVPAMAIFYLAGGLFVLVRYASEVPGAIALVFESAFTGTAATGGFAGSTMMLALRYGVARGLFSNEAGLGSAPMDAAAQRIIPSARACGTKCSWTRFSCARRPDWSSS
jgi:AGCS family alanine or glycine:cation symporter